MDINADKLESVKKEIEKYTGNVIALKCDISNESQVYETVKKAADVFGKVDILVNNAALWRDCSSVSDTSTEMWHKYFDVNVFGTLPTQIGYCCGHNSFLNATEWHTSSEINIAVTPLILILGHRWDIVNGIIDSSKFKAFYLPKGTVTEVYATTLHYTPCQVTDDGFGCIVALPEGTNTPLDTESKDKLLTAKNKWLLAHTENKAKIKQGAVAGITGENIFIHY